MGSIGEDMEQEGVVYTVVAKVDVTTLETETTDWDYLLRCMYTLWSAISLLDIHPEEMWACV